MKHLGIDYGAKNIGLAVSDDSGAIAFPKIVLKNDSKLMDNLGRIIKDEKIEVIVIGESVNQSGLENTLHKAAKNFAGELDQNFLLPIFFEKEHFSSFEAHARQGKERFTDRKSKIEKTQSLDAKAAAVILQRYLDKNK